jgi:hypothetical protein
MAKDYIGGGSKCCNCRLCNDSRILSLCSTINRELGNYEKAIEYYTKVVENWPKYEAAASVQAMIPQAYERFKSEGTLSAGVYLETLYGLNIDNDDRK